VSGSPAFPFPLPRRSPEELGIPTAALAALTDRLQAEGLDPHALVIARGGEIAFETAWAPYRLDRAALVYSASKTFTSLAIGFLADEARLSLDDSAGALLDLPNPYGITVRHLLTMNTGHSAAQIERFGEDPSALLSTAPEHTPGSFFAYNTPASHTLSAIVTAVTGELLTAYLRPRLLDPLGIGDRWMSASDGVEQGGFGFHLTAEDLVRTATMLGDDGRFAGVQVAPEWYVDELSRPWSSTADFDGPPAPEGEINDWALGYGYQVWRGRQGFRLDGAAGQFGLVLPEQGLAIGYQGATLETQAILRAFADFVAAVAAAGAAAEGVDVSGVVGAVADGADASEAADALASASAAGDARAASAAHAALSTPHDSWDARAQLPIMAEAPFDAAGLTLTDTADGWTVALPGVGDLTVGPEWRDLKVQKQAEPAQAPGSGPDTLDPACFSLATRGEQQPDGTVLIHIVSTTSPHRTVVRRDPDGTLHSGWHIPPLHGGWPVLAVPPVVTRVQTRAAALLLDMDGTLVDSTAVVERLWTEWALAHAIDPARVLAIIHGRQGQESMAMLLPDRPHEINLAENRDLLALETAQTEGVVAIAGAAQLLRDLVGLPHALVTSATLGLAQARMDVSGLAMPPVVVTAEDVTRSKPDPEGFLAAARALGIEPGACIVVEDSVNGIHAGLAAGMRVIGVGAHAVGATWRVMDASGIHVAPAPGGGIAVTLDA